jgi:hypothetical protein
VGKRAGGRNDVLTYTFSTVHSPDMTLHLPWKQGEEVCHIEKQYFVRNRAVTQRLPYQNYTRNARSCPHIINRYQVRRRIKPLLETFHSILYMLDRNRFENMLQKGQINSIVRRHAPHPARKILAPKCISLWSLQTNAFPMCI